MASEHEIMLQTAIKKLEDAGFRIIRFDRRAVPDAIAVKGKKIFAIEASTSFASIYLTKRKFSQSQYDEEIIITRPYTEHYHKPEVYRRVLALRIEGKSYGEIRRVVMEEFKLKSLSRSTICDWIKGKKKPLTLLNEKDPRTSI